jgi:membrane protein
MSAGKQVRTFLKGVVDGWLKHEGARLAASLSFYTLLSLAPLVILTIALTSVALGRPAAQAVLLSEAGQLMGPDGSRAVTTVITYGKEPHSATWASVIGIVLLLFGASSVFGELQSALNKIWEVRVRPGYDLLSLVKSRMFSFAMVLAIGFMSLASLTISAVLATLGTYFDSILPAPAWVLITINSVVSFAIITALIGVVLKYVPDARIPWRDVWVGATTTAVLFTIGKALIGLYLGKAAVGSAYGAAGSFVAVVVWVYYSAMIFYFGAEMTRERHARDRPIVSAPSA